MAVIQKSDDTWKIAALLASTTDVPVNSVLPIIDGVQTQHGNRVLLKNQTDPTENGIYVVQSMTLAKDSDNNVAWAFVNGGVVRVLGGSTNLNTEWYIAPITAADYPTASKVFTTSPFGGGGGSVGAANGLGLVSGNIELGGTVNKNTNIELTTYNMSITTTSGGDTLFIDGATGNIGIGTLLPTAMLDIASVGSGTVGLNLNTVSTQDSKIHFRTNNATTARSQMYVEDSTQTLNIYTVNSDTIFWNGNGLAQTKTLTLFTDTSAKFEKSVTIGSVLTLDGVDTGNYPIRILSSRNDLTRMKIQNQGATQTDIEIAINGGANALYFGVSSASTAFIDNRTGNNLLLQNTGITGVTFDNSGKLGIGVSPSYKLDISSASSAAFRVSTVATYNDAVIQSDQYSASLSINAVTTSPIGGYNTGLYLNSVGVRRGSFNSESTTSVTTLESANGYWLLLKNSATESIGLGQGGNYIQFGTNGTTKMLIDGVSGNVGIGTLSATSKLTVAGGTHLQLNDTVFRVDIGGSAGQVLFYRNADISFMMNPYPSAFNTSFRFLSNPVGTSYEAGIEHTVKGTLSANSGNVIGEVLNIGSTGSFTGNIYGKYIQKSNYLNTNATFYPLVAMGGNVGIGTTTPTALLEVNGDIKTAQPSANGAGAWKLGKKVTATVSLVTTDYIEVDIDGVVYKLALVS